jgi:hypothetical protein
MEAVQTSETSVNSFQSARRYNPEDSHRLRQGFTSQFWNCFNVPGNMYEIYIGFLRDARRKTEDFSPA